MPTGAVGGNVQTLPRATECQVTRRSDRFRLAESPGVRVRVTVNSVDSGALPLGGTRLTWLGLSEPQSEPRARGRPPDVRVGPLTVGRAPASMTRSVRP